MSHEAFIESLEENHRFPGPYQLKVIGENSETFVASILLIVREELRLLYEPRHQLKQTPQGRHVSITLDVTVKNAAQVVALYDKLQAHEEVGYVM